MEVVKIFLVNELIGTCIESNKTIPRKYRSGAGPFK